MSKFRWIRKDEDELKWIARYLTERLRMPLHWGLKDQPDGGYARICHAAQYLGESIEGRLELDRLKNALRQYRYRSAAKGRKACTFTLPNETKKTLSNLAKRQGRAESDLVIELISRAEIRASRLSEQERYLQQELMLERAKAKEVDSSWAVKYHEAMAQVEKLASLLSMWELAMECEDPGYDGDEVLLRKETMKKVKAVRNAVSYAKTMHALRAHFPSKLRHPGPPWALRDEDLRSIAVKY